jgi:hypothetical protein
MRAKARLAVRGRQSDFQTAAWMCITEMKRMEDASRST